MDRDNHNLGYYTNRHNKKTIFWI